MCCGKIGVFFRVRKFAFYKKKGCFSTPISVAHQCNRGRFFTWRTLICPMFYMRVRGPGPECGSRIRME